MIRTNRLSTYALFLAGAVALSVGVAACSGGGGGGGEAAGLTNCQIVWANQGSVSQRYDVYIIDMPIEAWTDGEKTYDVTVPGSEIAAIYYDEIALTGSNEGLYLSRGITTAGTFSVTASQGTNQGEPVMVADDGSQLYFGLDGNDNIGSERGDGGVAAFTGVWSNPDPVSNPTPGQPGGRVTLNYDTSGTGARTALSIGSFTRYAVCYDVRAGFVPMSVSDRVVTALLRNPVFASP